MSELWKVARVNATTLAIEDAARFSELLAWVRSLGVDVKKITANMTVTQDDGKAYWLHLSAYVYDGEGRKVVDHAERRVYSRPLVLPITEYPAWLPAVSHQQGDS